LKVIVTGGGTGGHIYPALALARYMVRSDSTTDILYVGTATGMEKDIVMRANFPFEAIEASGLRRKLSIGNLRTVWRTLRGFHQAKQLVRRFQPDVVVGTGGYVCAPMIYAAKRLKIPTLILEPDAFPGLTNRLLSRVADMVAVCYPDVVKRFPKAKKLMISGNPRGGEVCLEQPDDVAAMRAECGLNPERKTVVVIGGSRGARPINDATIAMLDKVAKQRKFQLLYVTGQIHYESVLEQVRRRGLDQSDTIVIRPFVYDMPALLHATDIAVGRAGATSLAEYTALGIPSVLIPSPYVTNNLQEHNAKWLADHGAAVIVKESELSGASLFKWIDRLVNDGRQLAQMREKSLALGQPDAAQMLCMTIAAMARGRQEQAK